MIGRPARAAVISRFSVSSSLGATLITGGKAALADPPSAHVASWNAAFTAMVRAGEDLNAGKLTAATAESSIAQARINAFDSQTT